ncbi:MAG: hypothetical protein RLY35_2128 [Bacteroidota bacterium]|jgi:O-antigen/teichoic acid export membrane protein
MLKKIIQNNPLKLKSEFAKNMRTLMIGTILSQLVVVAFIPVLSRVFTPKDFTTLEQFTMILNILVVVITGKYEFAIMHPKEKEDARHILFLSMVLALIGSVLVAFFGLFFKSNIGEYYNNPEFGGLFWMLGPALFAFAVFNIISYWFSRQKKYAITSKSKIINSTISEPLKLGFAKLNMGSLSLVVGTTIGQILSAIYSFICYHENEPLGLKNISKERLKKNALRYKDYPTISIWGSILNRLAQWAHIGIFTQFYGLVAIAWMALSRRVVQAPLNIISGSYSQVFFQKISEMEDLLELKKQYYKALKQLSVFALSIIAIAFLIPDNTIGWIFGDAWQPALDYLRVLTIWYAINFVTSSLSFVSLRIEIQKISFFLDLMHFVFIYGTIFIAYKLKFDAYHATVLLVASKVIYFTINIVVQSIRLNRYVHENK